MPYAHIRKKIPRELDKRVKYTKADLSDILHRYKSGDSQRQIARDMGISRRYISFIINPHYLAKCKKQFKERSKDGRYYNKDKWSVTMRKHRRYKQSIKNKLI